ncbi:CoF synthetase [Falsigemmobacter faecalis]|uniref:CoF synthetase n=1 Tax=Falsigemmobacter faecalis TaxID=2488730 RepID=A0A3P3DH13_9RHOB|nr:CoF synthetase [Falsigemmobacter faecalis]RRH73555.1 CoF synthetase [Falsigemmobacter faecalis]
MKAAGALISFAAARIAASGRVSRARFEAWQARALARWLARDVIQVAAYRRGAARLQDLSVMDKAQLMADFAAFNRPGITAAEVAGALSRDCRIGDYTVGASTGTSGNRGYFVISDAERYRWLGSLLGKAIPDLLLSRQRVAVILPQNTRLYDAARQTGRIELRFFDITAGPETFIEALEAFAPTVLIAPPRLLSWLAARGTVFRPKRIFSAAETLETQERAEIEAWAGLTLRQIYMATEGLLGVSCAHGSLHLAEDSVFFEFEPLGDGLVSPLITSFRRETQIMARYRMNDLLRLSDEPCACGSPLRVISEVAGRRDDCFEIAGRLITPDALRNAVVKSDPRITDYRVIRSGDLVIQLVLPPDLPEEAAARALAALRDYLSGRGLGVGVVLLRQPLGFDPSRKLRRVENRVKARG